MTGFSLKWKVEDQNNNSIAAMPWLNSIENCLTRIADIQQELFYRQSQII